MFLKQIFEPKLAQYAYIIGCQKTGEAIVIDPQRDIERYQRAATENGLKVVAVADTHIHADYLTGSRQYAHDYGVTVYSSDEGGEDWKVEWARDSNYNCKLVRDGDSFNIGAIEFRVHHTPGHTPEHICFSVIDHGAGADEPMGLLTGDFVFVGDVGRPDLLESAAGEVGAMEPSARALGKSLQEFKSFPPHLQVWPAHGAGSACGKSLGAVPMSTVGYELKHNSAINHCSNIDEFVDFILTGQPEPPLYFARMKRDNKLGPAIMEGIPQPHEMAPESLITVLKGKSAAVLDTRSWNDYASGHLSGSLCAPLNGVFNTTAGCYVREDEDIYLIAEADKVPTAVLDLIRIGLDKIVGYVTPKSLAGYFDSSGSAAVTKDYSVKDFDSRVDKEQVFMLDVRRASEIVEEGGIPGAFNIAHTRLAERLNEIPRGREIVVSCHTGSRSAYAAGFLDSRGYNVARLKEGFVGWRDSGKPLAKPVRSSVVA